MLFEKDRHDPERFADTEVLVGIDVGGSKTHIRVESAVDGNVLVDEIHSSTSWATLDDTTRAATLLSLVETTARGRIVALVAGVHGNDSPEQEVILSGPLTTRYPQVKLLNDSHLLILAHGKQSGTGVIAGTGSSATATTGDHAVLTVGGWGWILGDEGGAVGLVRDAVKHVLGAYDRGEDDPLSDRLLACFELEHPHALANFISTVEPRIWASAAAVVFDAARHGSPRALALIDAHAAALATMVQLLGDRGGDIETIVCAGGVITNQPLLFDAFTREVRARLGTSIDVALLTEPPVAGALSLARRLYEQSKIQDPQPGHPPVGRSLARSAGRP